jgi:hypothetical protein
MSPKMKKSEYKYVMKFCFHSMIYIFINEKIQELQKIEFSKKREEKK